MSKKVKENERLTPIREVVAKLPPDARERMYLDVMSLMSEKIFTRNIIIMVLSIMTFYLVVMKLF